MGNSDGGYLAGFSTKQLDYTEPKNPDLPTGIYPVSLVRQCRFEAGRKDEADDSCVFNHETII